MEIQNVALVVISVHASLQSLKFTIFSELWAVLYRGKLVNNNIGNFKKSVIERFKFDI